MSISPNTIYNSFVYNIEGVPTKKIEGQNMDGDFVAGLLVALASVLLREGNFNSNRSVEIRNGNNTPLNIFFDRNTYLVGLSNYYIMSSIKDGVSEDISLPTSLADEQFMGIWIRMPYIDDLDLYTFSEDTFIKGFIYMSNNILEQDFREGIYGGPFIYDHGYNFIEVSGYDIPPMPNVNKEVPNYPLANSVDFI